MLDVDQYRDALALGVLSALSLDRRGIHGVVGRRIDAGAAADGEVQRSRGAGALVHERAFAEHGLDAPLDDIAKRAGVGGGTLYRRFPRREDLVAAVFADRMAGHVAAIEAARGEPDPWTAFAGHVTRLCREQARDQGLADLLAIGHRGRVLHDLRAQAYKRFAVLIDAAKAQGSLRADFTAEDVVLLMMANAGVVERSGPSAPAASERFVALALDGFRSVGASPAPPALSPRTLIAALRRRR